MESIILFNVGPADGIMAVSPDASSPWSSGFIMKGKEM